MDRLTDVAIFWIVGIVFGFTTPGIEAQSHDVLYYLTAVKEFAAAVSFIVGTIILVLKFSSSKKKKNKEDE